MARFVFTPFDASEPEAYDTLVSNVSELQTVLTNSGGAYNGQTIALAPGTYDLSSATFTNQPRNVTYISEDPNNRAVIDRWRLQSANGAGTFTMRRINIVHTLPAQEFQFWGPGAGTVYSIINADSGPFTAITLEEIDCNGGMLPWLQGGRMIVDNAFLWCRGGSNVTVRNCRIYNVMSGVKINSVNTFLIEGNEIFRTHADPINMLNAVGHCENGVVRNNHIHTPAGNTAGFHCDAIQFQPTSASGNFFRNIEIYGNTACWGTDTPIAQVDPTRTATFNAYSTSFSVAGTEHGQETRLTPSGNMTVTMPSAVGNRGQQFNFRYTTGSGAVSFALNGSDTYNGGAAPSLTASGQWATFVSDGAGNWDKLRPGYRAWWMHRDYNLTAGDLEATFVTMLDGSSGNVTMTLPASGARTFHVQRVDASANSVSIVADGDSITLNGTSGLSSITMTPGYGLTISRTGDGDWTAVESNVTFAFLFSNTNAGNWENITVHSNVMMTAAGIRIEDAVQNFRVFNNTIIPTIRPDQNGDGYIGQYEGNFNTNLSQLSGSGIIQNNFSAGNFAIGTFPAGNGQAPANQGNQILGINNSDPIPASITDRFNGTTRPAYVATSRSEILNVGLSKPGGPLDGTFVGALGTTISNGYYNFATGQVNSAATLPNPALLSSIPAHTENEISINAPVILTFSQIVQAGTGTIVLRSGGSVVETFNVATGLGDNGGAVTFSGARVTVTPGAALAMNTTYAVRIASTAIVGTIYQTTFAGIADDTTLTFTTQISSLSYASSLVLTAQNSEDTRYVVPVVSRDGYLWGSGEQQNYDTTNSLQMSQATKDALRAAGEFVMVMDLRLSEGATTFTSLNRARGFGGTEYNHSTSFSLSTGNFVATPTGWLHSGNADVSALYGVSAGTVYRVWHAYTLAGNNTRTISIVNEQNSNIDFRRHAVFQRATFDADNAVMDAQIAALPT
jgi:hypothetical protein